MGSHAGAINGNTRASTKARLGPAFTSDVLVAKSTSLRTLWEQRRRLESYD
jgi:hypothetical protein